MGQQRRLIKDGALFAENIGDLNRLVKMGATVTGTPEIVASPFGGPALHFDGIGDRLNIPTPEPLKDGTSPWTVLIWAAPDSSDPGTNSPIFSTTQDASHYALLWHNVDGAPSPAQHDFRMQNGGIRRVSSSIPVSAGRYDMIGISHGIAAGSGELVVNGISQGNVPDLAIFDCWGADFVLGYFNAPYWAGKIATVAIFPRQLSAAEQLGIYEFQTFSYKHNLVSHWRMDDTGIVQDVGWKGNGYDLTGVNSPVLANGIDGRKALKFNGSNEYLRRAVSDWQSGDSQGTICAWAKRGSLGTTDAIFTSSYESGVVNYLMFRFLSTDELQVQQRNGDTTDAVKGSTITVADRWYHVALVSTGIVYKLFLDGVEETLTVTSGSNTGDWWAETSLRENIVIGAIRNTAPDSLFGGVIDEVQYYDAPLTNLQVRDLFEMQKQGKI